MQEPESPAASEGVAYFRVCSICRKPIDFSARYYRCSVSTCNRSRTALFFCSVPCWDAHVPELRHRDAWAEEARAPTLEAFEAEERAQQRAEAGRMVEKNVPERKIVTQPESQELPRDVLVVVSKLKAYVKARSGYSTSDAVVEMLSDHLRRLCDLAADNATVAGRKTLLDRDFKNLLRTLP